MRLKEKLNFSPPDDRTPAGVLESTRIQIIKLKFEGGAKESIASALRGGRYSPGTNGIIELGMNILDHAITTPDQTTQAVITLPNPDTHQPTHDIVKVEGLFEEGMGPLDFNDALAAGAGKKREKKGSAAWNFGLKESLWLWGLNALVLATKRGSSEMIVFDEPGFGDPEVEYSGEREVPVFDLSQETGVKRVREILSKFETLAGYRLPDQDEGRVDIVASGLKLTPEQQPKRMDVVHAAEEMFRPRLVTEQLKLDRANLHPNLAPRIFTNNKGEPIKLHDRVAVWVIGGSKKGAYQVMPPDFHLDKGYTENLRVARTTADEVVPYWLGEKKPEAKHLDPGVRIYTNGQLLFKDYFVGHDKDQPNLSRLIGEIHVDYITGFTRQVTSLSKAVNKPNTDAAEWQRMETAVKSDAREFFDALLTRVLEQEPTIDLSINRIFDEGRKMADQALGLLAQSGILDQEILAGLGKGEAEGQKPGGGERKGGTTPKRTGVKIKKWDQQAGETFPTPEASSKIPRRRKGGVSKVDMTSFSPGDPRVSVIIEEHDQRVLRVNKLHPDVAHALALRPSDEAESNVRLGWIAATELVRHAIMDHGGEDTEDILGKLIEGTYEVGKIMRTSPLAAVVEHRTPVPKIKTGGKKK